MRVKTDKDIVGGVTPDKWYEFTPITIHVEGGIIGGTIVTDDGSETRYILLANCGHLNGGNWDIDNSKIRTFTTMSLEEVMAIPGIVKDGYRVGVPDEWSYWLDTAMEALIYSGRVKLHFTGFDEDGDLEYTCPITGRNEAWPQQAVVSYD